MSLKESDKAKIYKVGGPEIDKKLKEIGERMTEQEEEHAAKVVREWLEYVERVFNDELLD